MTIMEYVNESVLLCIRCAASVAIRLTTLYEDVMLLLQTLNASFS